MRSVTGVGQKLLLWAAGVGVGVMEGGCGQRVGEARMGLWQSAGVIVGFRFGEEFCEQRRNGLAGAEVRMSWPSRWPFPGTLSTPGPLLWLAHRLLVQLC